MSRRIRRLGAIGSTEAADGMLPFGNSTGFVFVVVRQIEQIIGQVQDYDL